MGTMSQGDGTEANPFATVTKALTVTGPGEINRIYVCAGDYVEPDTLNLPDRVAIYGGLSCDAGVRVASGNRARAV